MCNPHQNKRSGPGCCGPSAGRIPGFIQPWLLLFLSEKPAHGYQLLDKLVQNEDTRGVDPASLYRTLRQFERDGLVRSWWNVDGGGPARRVYEITPDGIEFMRAWAKLIRDTRGRLDRVLHAYEQHIKKDSKPNGGETHV